MGLICLLMKRNYTTNKTPITGKFTCKLVSLTPYGSELLFGCLEETASSTPRIHGPARISLSLYGAKLDPVNHNRQTRMSFTSGLKYYTDNPVLTWSHGWCRCCLAVGGQVFASCGRRMEEGNPSDTETASLLDPHLSLWSSPAAAHGCPPALSLICSCCCFLFLIDLRMWDEDSRTPAECSGWPGLLKGNHKDFILCWEMKYPVPFCLWSQHNAVKILFNYLNSKYYTGSAVLNMFFCRTQF